jgi:ATP-dependent helicase HrpB
MSYPIVSVIPAIRENLSQHRVVILEAPPGAGKSTVLPLHLLREPWLGNKKIIMLEPRRLAARSVAMRLADLHGEEVGQTVGYRIRFESRTSDSTRLEVVTEGILTRIIQQDNAIDGTGLLIFDEFHERSLHADLALALSLQVQQILRDDLHLLIMSATLDGDRLSDLLDAPVVRSSGRQYPVSIHYLSDTTDTQIANRVVRGIRKAVSDNSGDILAFLPGAGEIARAAEALEAAAVPAVLYPLYGDLNFRKQQEAILPHPEGKRKVVLATSIAETSLTIEGVSVVVDSGYARVPRFDPRSGFTRLETVRVTADAADQRAGRAGRLGPGVCYRLWSEASHGNLLPHRTPEILEADLAPLMLELGNWGVRNVSDLTWITPPPAGAVSQALELLNALRAVDENGITARGREMLRLPTHPRIAHMLLESRDSTNNIDLPLACDIAALLEERDPMPKGSGADLSLRIEVLRRWRKGERVPVEKNLLDRIERLALSWRKMFRTAVDNSAVADTDVGKCVMQAFPERVARQIAPHGERYKMVNGRVARLPDHDPLQREPWLVIAQVDAGYAEGKIFLAAALDQQDVTTLATERENIAWDPEREMVTASVEMRVGNLVVNSKPSTTMPWEKVAKELCRMVGEKGLAFLNWGDQEKSWQARVLSLRRWRASESWPDVSDETLAATAGEWLTPFLTNVYKRSELLKLDLSSILMTLLPWELNQSFPLLAPTKLPVPSGSLISLTYFADGRPPVMEVRLQEVFGLLETPAVNEGRNKVVMHLLSPGYKPVQVTQDLKSFWATTYQDVRKELRTRYPKHAWPEDPWTAQAVRGVKRK